MNHLVLLDAQAGRLEKILSGTKTRVVREVLHERQTCTPKSREGDSNGQQESWEYPDPGD